MLSCMVMLLINLLLQVSCQLFKKAYENFFGETQTKVLDWLLFFDCRKRKSIAFPLEILFNFPVENDVKLCSIASVDNLTQFKLMSVFCFVHCSFILKQCFLWNVLLIFQYNIWENSTFVIVSNYTIIIIFHQTMWLLVHVKSYNEVKRLRFIYSFNWLQCDHFQNSFLDTLFVQPWFHCRYKTETLLLWFMKTRVSTTTQSITTKSELVLVFETIGITRGEVR